MLVTFASVRANDGLTVRPQSEPTIQRSTVRVRIAPFDPIMVSVAKPVRVAEVPTIRPRQDLFPASADSEPLNLPELSHHPAAFPPIRVSNVPTPDNDNFDDNRDSQAEKEAEGESEGDGDEYDARDASAAATFSPEPTNSSPLPRPACEVAIHGPSLCFREREAIYEVRVGEIPDSLHGTIAVACVLPAGMQMTVVSRPVEFDGPNNRIVWRPAGSSSGGDSLFLKIRAVTKGEKPMRVTVFSGDKTVGQGEHLTTVIARPTVDEFID